MSEDKKLKVYHVSGDFADGRKWPGGSPSFTYREAVVRAFGHDDALALCEEKFGRADVGGISVEEMPETRGVHWS
jgi:hypothetical protein